MKDRGAWGAAVHGVAKSWTGLFVLATKQQLQIKRGRMEHKWNLKIKTTRCFSFYSNRCCVSTCLCSCSLKTKHLYPQSHSVMQFKWRGCMVCELHLNEAVKTINFFKRKSWLSPPWFTLLLTSILRNPEPHSGRCSRFLNPKHKNHNFVLTLRLAT